MRDLRAPRLRRVVTVAQGHDAAVVVRGDAAYVRLQDAGAPMLVVDACDRIVDATHPARTLLAKLELPSEPGEMLPAALVAELKNALLGEAIMWRPRGDGGPILGSTRYRLGDRHHFLLVREITEQQRAMAQRLHQQRLLETGKLVAHIAHELRTPLASIVYNADVLGSRDLGSSTELVEEIKLAADNLRRTIAGLLDYVRLGPPIDSTMTLRELWDRVSSLLHPIFRAGRHTLSIHLHDPDVRVRANPMTLEQIFVNLLVNSIEASTKPATIEITSGPIPSDRPKRWRAKRAVLISTQDDGPGIPPERRVSAFEAFVTTKPNGTGLGLTLAREAALSIGGHVQLADCARGCRVEVVLPMEDA